MRVIEHQLTVSELRMWQAADASPSSDFDACCLLMWESPNCVWLRMLRGTLSRRLLRELLSWMVMTGIETVRAHRSAKHVLPLARQMENGSYELRVAELAARLDRKAALQEGARRRV